MFMFDKEFVEKFSYTCLLHDFMFKSFTAQNRINFKYTFNVFQGDSLLLFLSVYSHTSHGMVERENVFESSSGFVIFLVATIIQKLISGSSNQKD
ncbi:CLUMA_CG003505, isoform A [Clunio marinus]|uniref:CLUMA_CG003505, isoform A n=1 Tax=Clunio marinus TaxID=568069 RepID=A0A1J1HTI7_9DIPT|nr:CLUMA_CG003505, isoform A [Clunio marinus]